MEPGFASMDESFPYKFVEVDHEIKKKVSAISALENIIALGTEDGYLYSYEVKEFEDGYGYNLRLEEIGEGSKRGNDKIVKIQILPAQFLITLLVDKNFFMVSMDSLSTVQEIKTKEIKNNVYMYSIRKKYDMNETIDPLNISLAIATSKSIFFWKLDDDFRFTEELTMPTSQAKKFSFGDKIYAMEWVGSTIYIGTRNSYILMNINTGSTQDLKIVCPLKEPQISVIKDSQIILLGKGNKVWSYNLASEKISWFLTEMGGDNFKIQAHNLNLIIMSDRELRVYSPEKNKMLQDFGTLVDPARYTAVGIKKYEVLLAYNPNPSNRKQSKTILKVLKEAPIDQQITKCLREGEDAEAERLFYIENSNKPNLEDLKKEFELNMGWVKFFERLDFESAVNNMIDGEIDPREMLFYFGYHNYCHMLRESITKPPKVSVEDYINDYMISYEKKVDMGMKIKNAKEALLNILMNWYRKYIQENKSSNTRFNTSSFSNTSKFIKEDQREINIGDLWYMLETVVIFINSDLDNVGELERFIEKSKGFDKDETIAYLSKRENKEPLAVLYECIGEIGNALKIWREIKGDKAIK
jgi:hypothetical protein